MSGVAGSSAARGGVGGAARRARARVRFREAEAVRERVQAVAGPLRLRGARRHTLGAVLKLLCGWSRITDDRVGLPQIVELIAAAGGRRYDLKTIGRALASLAADELIVYRPAQGRGARSFIAIHDRFVGGVEVLERDRSGRVIADYSGRSGSDSVTFSAASPYINQKNYPPTPRTDSPVADPRPVGVKVSSEELREVLRGLPEPLTRLPRHLRWMLGREIRGRLERGWRPEQILDVLAAPMPADIRRPWRLALWRLRHNVVGVGPRLRPAQQAWDARQRAAERAAAHDVNAGWFAEVSAVTTNAQRAELLHAHQVKFGRAPADPVAALAGAGRRVARLFPDLPLAAALTRWTAEVIEGQHAGQAPTRPVTEPSSLSAELLTDLAISDGCSCVACGSDRGIFRPELPLAAMATVCDLCWTHFSVEPSDSTGAVVDDCEVAVA